MKTDIIVNRRTNKIHIIHAKYLKVAYVIPKFALKTLSLRVRLCKHIIENCLVFCNTCSMFVRYSQLYMLLRFVARLIDDILPFFLCGKGLTLAHYLLMGIVVATAAVRRRSFLPSFWVTRYASSCIIRARVTCIRGRNYCSHNSTNGEYCIHVYIHTYTGWIN